MATDPKFIGPVPTMDQRQRDLFDLFKAVGPVDLAFPKLPRVRKSNPKRRAVLVLTPSK